MIMASSSVRSGSNMMSYLPNPLSLLEVRTYRPDSSTINPSTKP